MRNPGVSPSYNGVESRKRWTEVPNSTMRWKSSCRALLIPGKSPDKSQILFTCPYYVPRYGGSFETFLHAVKCIHLDFNIVYDEVVTICLMVSGHTPDCTECPIRKENSSLLLSNLSILHPQITGGNHHV
jgi:hypothetical protein